MDVVEQLRRRDAGAVEELLRHYGPLMRYIIAPILADERDREECVSDAALRVWEKIDSFDEKRGSFPTWLTVLTRNTALNHARRVEQSQELTEDIPAETSPEQEVLARERQAALRRAIWDLTQKEQILFYRKYYYRQSTAQIAAEMGMTERAVEGRLYRIRRRLRDELGGVWDDGTGF